MLVEARLPDPVPAPAGGAADGRRAAAPRRGGRRAAGVIAAAALGIITSAGASPLRAQRAELSFQQALYVETVLCDPRRAIVEYENVLEINSRSARVSALTHLHLGKCYRLTGDRDKAQEHFRIVTTLYPGEREAADLAAQFLGMGTRQDPALFLSEDTLFYFEILQPSEPLRVVGEALREAALIAREADPRPIDPGAGEDPMPADAGDPRMLVKVAAAILNEGFQKEFEKIKGLAIGIPPGGSIEGSHLGVFFPGASDVLRGFFQGAASLFDQELVREFSLYRVEERSGDLHLAVGDGAVIWGRPRALVVDAIERYSTKGRSLAQSPDFRRSLGARSGSFIFAYASRGWLPVARSLVEPESQAAFDAFVRLSGLESIHPLAAALAWLEHRDTLHARFFAWNQSRESRSLWSALRTRPLGRGVSRTLPAETIAFFALRPDPLLDRARDLLEDLDRLAESTARTEGGFDRAAIAEMREALEIAPFSHLVEEIELGAIGLVPADEALGRVSPALILEFNDPQRGEAALQDSLTELFSRFLGTPASRRILESEIDVDGRKLPYRHVEPFPGTRVGYARQGRQYFVTLDPRIAQELLLASSRTTRPRLPLPEGISKVLAIKPAAILETFPRSDLAAEWRHVLSHVENLIVFTREAADSLSLEMQVPEFTTALRAVLRSVALAAPGAGAAEGGGAAADAATPRKEENAQH